MYLVLYTDESSIFSSRRALLIREFLKWPFFRFASLLDGPGWWLLGEWSGHLSIFPVLARRAVLTLVADAYLRWPGS